MKILLIDNLSIHLEKLKQLLTGHELTIVDFRELDGIDTKNFDLFVLSGGSDFSIRKYENLYQAELDLIKNSSQPVIGICLGFQLIGYAYGAELESLGDKQKDLVELELLVDHPIFKNLVNFKVAEAHRWAVKRLPAELTALARSEDCFEVVKHQDREVYGLQFHPEILTEDNDGQRIFENLLGVLNDKGNCLNNDYVD